MHNTLGVSYDQVKNEGNQAKKKKKKHTKAQLDGSKWN